MNSKVKKKWVKALRSSEYAQGKEFLCSVDPQTDNAKYCCLGVLIETVRGESTWEPVSDDLRKTAKRDNFLIFLTPKGKSDDGFLSENFFNEVGLSESDARELARRNDRGHTFKAIADWIEKNL